MEKVSLSKLAELVSRNRKKKNMTQQDLQDQTGINRMLISRIERRDFVPSIAQLEALSKTLDFSIQELIEADETQNVFVAMRGQARTRKEEEGIEKLFTMMLTLKKQRILRSRLYGAR